MSNQEIINRASCIVRRHLDDMADYHLDTAGISRAELIQISMALAVAGAMYREGC